MPRSRGQRTSLPSQPIPARKDFPFLTGSTGTGRTGHRRRNITEASELAKEKSKSSYAGTQLVRTAEAVSEAARRGADAKISL
jgi:hypothetical protein